MSYTDKAQMVHDALAECKDTNKLYLLIHECFESAKLETGAERDNTFKLIGSIVFHAISDYEKGEQTPDPDDCDDVQADGNAMLDLQGARRS